MTDPATAPAAAGALARNANAKLTAVYERLVAKLAAVPDLPIDVSAPLLLEVPVEYFRAPRRFMIVGQQTRKWGHISDPRYGSVEALRARYTAFALARGIRHSPFWRAAWQLYGRLVPDGPDQGFLWSNLIKVDQSNRPPSPAIEAQLSDVPALATEIEVARPDVVVFVTGWKYDDRLRATFPGLEWHTIEHGLQQLHGIPCAGMAFRTYHPQYLQRKKRWSLLDRICEEACAS